VSSLDHSRISINEYNLMGYRVHYGGEQDRLGKACSTEIPLENAEWKGHFAALSGATRTVVRETQAVCVERAGLVRNIEYRTGIYEGAQEMEEGVKKVESKNRR
jgi:hypothetical protein